MRVAVLVKQVPALGELRLGPDGRLMRAGLELELNPYCRRAVAKGVELGSAVAFTLGPPEAVEVLREAVAWGAERGVLITDPAFAGSDTLATARALAAALRSEGPFDLILTGRNSVDADTGQLAPQVAELLGLPFLGPVRSLELTGRTVHARCERDDGYVHASVDLPAVLSAAERLCAPAKVPAADRAQVPVARIRVLGATDLGAGPWGAAGSPTSVGRTRLLHLDRRRERGTGSPADQVDQAAGAMHASGLLAHLPLAAGSQRTVTADPARGSTKPAFVPSGDLAPEGAAWAPVPASPGTAAPGRGDGRLIAVLAEPDRDRSTRELLGAAASLGGRTVLIAPPEIEPRTAWSWSADELLHVPAVAGEDVAAAVLAWCRAASPWALLAASTCHGREVAARVAAGLGAGLTGDAVELGLAGQRLVCWKPAFGGQLLAAVTASSVTQLVTVRPGALPLPEERHSPGVLRVRTLDVTPTGRVRVTDVVRDDDPDALALAPAVVGVGQGIDPADYPDLKPLLDLLGAELGATRKVTDLGWLPRSRQIGVTGQSVAPALYIALAVHGKLTHLAGVRRAGFVLAVNADPAAPIFDGADFGIVGDWREVLPLLVRALGAVRSPR